MAVERLGVLAQPLRLEIFRLLVQALPARLPAGSIARHLEVPSSTLSFHLDRLRRAGLVSARRNGRSIRYAADCAATEELIDYLTENCCRGLDSRKEETP